MSVWPGATVVADGVIANAAAQTGRSSTCVPRLDRTVRRAVYRPWGTRLPSDSRPFQVQLRAPAACARRLQTVRTSVPPASYRASVVVAGRVRRQVRAAVGRRPSPSCGKKLRDQRRLRAVRSTMTGVDAERRLPAASLSVTLKVYLPSPTAAPDAFRPFQVADHVGSAT